MTRRGQTAASSGAQLTPVFDLLFILTIAFVGVGVFLASSLRIEAGVRTMLEHSETARRLQEVDARQAEALVPTRDRLRAQLAVLEGVEPPDPVPEVTSAQLDRLYAEVAKHKARLAAVDAALDARLAELARWGEAAPGALAELRELRARRAALASLLDRLERLASEKRRKQRRVSALEAQVARESLPEPAQKGAPIVSPTRAAGRLKLLLLSEGRVYPYPEFFSVREGFSSSTATPSREGLSISQVLAPDSVVMREISTPAFRADGRVVLAVTSDSFSTYRVLRDALLEMRIDYGWEPQTGTEIRTGSRGRVVPSQGRR